MVISDEAGTHIIGTGLTFPRGTKGSCMRGSRLPPRIIAKHARQHDVYASNLLRQLLHPVPSLPQVSLSSSYVSNVPGVPCVDSRFCDMNHGER